MLSIDAGFGVYLCRDVAGEELGESV